MLGITRDYQLPFGDRLGSCRDQVVEMRNLEFLPSEFFEQTNMMASSNSEEGAIEADISMNSIIKEVLLDAATVKQKSFLSSIGGVEEASPSLPGSFPEERLSAPFSVKALVALDKMGNSFLAVYLKKALEKCAAVEDNINSNQTLKSIAEKVPFLSPAGALALFVLLSAAAAGSLAKRSPLLFSQLAGVSYPIYRSILAVERPRINDDERWLTYWSCFGLFTLLDHKSALIQRQVKTYFLPKLLILYWLSQDGSLVLYRRLIRPFLLQTKLLQDTDL